jgi:hypothetical protein
MEKKLAAIDEDINRSKTTKDSANALIVVTGNEQVCPRWVI